MINSLCLGIVVEKGFNEAESYSSRLRSSSAQ